VIKTQAADIWGMGVTLLIMLTGSSPEYKNNAIVDLEKRIEDLKDVSAELKAFLKRCLEENPEKRITS
jgi:serine/threonine protein kinase